MRVLSKTTISFMIEDCFKCDGRGLRKMIGGRNKSCHWCDGSGKTWRYTSGGKRIPLYHAFNKSVQAVLTGRR